MSKRSKSEPVVARRRDGSIYRSERVPVTKHRKDDGEIEEHKNLPTRRAYDLLRKKGIVR